MVKRGKGRRKGGEEKKEECEKWKMSRGKKREMKIRGRVV